jgi:hypothetical protein
LVFLLLARGSRVAAWWLWVSDAGQRVVEEMKAQWEEEIWGAFEKEIFL